MYLLITTRVHRALVGDGIMARDDCRVFVGKLMYIIFALLFSNLDVTANA